MLAKMVMKNSENPNKRTDHHFFKIVHPDQLTTQHLRIPSKFMKHISRKSYDQGVILEAPSGRHWHAKLCRTRDGTYIREGWPEFVTHHSLWDNEFLVFKYDGDMCFMIQIFDKNGCERENVYTSSEAHQETIVEKRKPGRPLKKKFVSCSSQKQGTPENIPTRYSANERGGPAKKKLVSPSRREPSPTTVCKGNLGKKIKNEERHKEPVEKGKQGRPPKKKFVSCSSQNQRTPENMSASYSGNERGGPAKKKLVSRSGKEQDTPPKKNASLEEPSPSTVCKENLGQKIKNEDTDEDDSLPIYERDTKTTRCLSTRETPTEEEAKLWKAVESFSSNHPYFISHLRNRTLWKTYLYIPAGFSKAHFPRHHINIILRNQKGDAWTVKLVCYNNRAYNLCGGWPAFVRANKLEEGDICIFELVDELEFCVHILRLLKEATICEL